ncbi:J domain-containing protein [Mesorhizobium sp. B1-1-5]|uniref:J domain-containing protein n=1 Tax=Mesorhizobium sp. B1-1-5 TaxID=2589979 RepID=UPI00112BDCC0|nr:J domain-containing protein [Mesorhizobium sp. B1-1-5]TPN75543.1 J domain-containing protein [Mesorhizobium sp. B1-1-5]
MSVSAFPLQWPAGRARKPAAARRDGRFNIKRSNGRYLQTHGVSGADALSRLQDELDRIGAILPVVSTNLQTRLDGLPRSGQPEPSDPGVALYFQLQGKPHCMPCDTYTKVAQNIAAIAAHIEATRAIERHGVSSVAEMFAGFQALPAPGARRHWREVLGIAPNVPVTATEIEYFFRLAAKKAHPDTGGSHTAMAELIAARDEALKAVRS